MRNDLAKFHELRADDPLVLERESGVISIGNIGRISADVAAFAKRTDAAVTALAALERRLAALESEHFAELRAARAAARRRVGLLVEDDDSPMPARTARTE